MINNVIAFVSIGAVFSIVWAFKNVLDKDRTLNKFPWLANKIFRGLAGLASCCLIFIAFIPEYSVSAFLSFLVTMISLLFYVTDQLRKQSYVDLVFESIDSNIFLSIPSSHYIQVQPGFFDRTILGKKDLIDKAELKHEKALEKIDFESNSVLFVKFTKNGFFDQHSTPTICTIWVLEGMIEINNKNYKQGESIILQGNESRYLKGIKPGLLLATIANS